jgi:4-amino-4-deoxy-L-arabinose transferase-like glycosyltransferase
MQARMKPAVLVIVIACAFRLVFASFTGLGIDESYMVAASHRFTASYFDHPLASWWLELASRRLFDGQSPIIVRLPFVILSAVSSWLLYALTNRLFGGNSGFWAVVAYSISPVFSLAFGCWVLPDGPLDAALLAFAYVTCRAAGIGALPAPKYWLAAGFFAGLAMLSKYNAALTIAGAAMFLLSDPHSRPAIRRWELWAGLIIAVLLFTPVMFWNAAHGWQSFAYQSGRATGLRLHPLAPLTIWGGEALFVLPWLWLPMIFLLIRALSRGPAQRPSWFLAMLAVIPIILFAVIGIWSSTKILYHWATPGYLLLLPLLGDWASRRGAWVRQIALFSAALLAGASLLIAAELTLGFIPHLDRLFPPGKSPLLQAVDWTSIRGQIPAGDAVAALRWYDAGKIGYALPGTQVTVFGPAPHEFGVSAPPASLIGRDFLLLAMPGDVSKIQSFYAKDFETLLPGPALTVASHGAVLLVIPTLIGHDLLRAP